MIFLHLYYGILVGESDECSACLVRLVSPLICLCKWTYSYLLQFGNSGVHPFQSICENAPPLKDLDSFESNLTDIANRSSPNQDISMVIGEGATTREMFSIPLLELEI